jgi:hypothetical protein
MDRSIYVGLVLAFSISGSGAIGREPVENADRVAIQQGSFQGCLEKMPAEVRARFGRLATGRFCSCYASKIADTITRAQIDAMLKANTEDDIPGYAEVMKNARRVCERQYMTRWG